jgi:predicted transposase YbfD/YdcC
MAKICKPILEFKEIIKSTGITPDDYSPPKKTIQRFLRLFKQISDQRVEGMIDYPLSEVILIAFLAILANSSTWFEIERFGIRKEKWLKKFLKLENGIPSHDTFRRVFALINPLQMEIATVNFLMDNLDSIKKSLKLKTSGPRHICVDGKEEKGTGRNYGTDEEIRNLQTLHVFDASSEICLFSRIIDKKTNEIPVAQELLKTLQLKDCIVSFDALHTQKDTIAIIVGQKGDYVGALKGNQGTLSDDAEALFTEEMKAKIKSEGNDYYESSEKSHGQVEVRRFYMLKAKQRFNGKLSWKNLRNFICYEKYTCNVITGKKATEIRYYITSLRDVELCAETIRGHWSIENKLHWHLDYSFGEDDNTTMDQNAFNNFSILNKMVLSLCKLVQPLMKNYSIRTLRKDFGWGIEESISQILNTFDEDVIKNVLENAQKSKK